MYSWSLQEFARSAHNRFSCIYWVLKYFPKLIPGIPLLLLGSDSISISVCLMSKPLTNVILLRTVFLLYFPGCVWTCVCPSEWPQLNLNMKINIIAWVKKFNAMANLSLCFQNCDVGNCTSEFYVPFGETRAVFIPVSPAVSSIGTIAFWIFCIIPWMASYKNR